MEFTIRSNQEELHARFANLNLNTPLPALKDIVEIKCVDFKGQIFILRKFDKSKPKTDSEDNEVPTETFTADFNDIIKTFVTLTDEQRTLIMHIYYKYKNISKNYSGDFGKACEDNPKIILQGPAGSGKSTIIVFLQKLITWEANKTKTTNTHQSLRVIKCAYTRKAAENIEGYTIHSILSIPVRVLRNLRSETIESKQKMLKDCDIFICDEISMVGKNLMKDVNSRLQQIFDSKKLYANRFVLLVGDLYQLDPVAQTTLYPNSKLWTCCEFYELNKIVRQQDETFINALNNFKDSAMRTEDIELFRSREIGRVKVNNIDEVLDSVTHIYYLNKDVDEYNSRKIDKSKGREEIVNTIYDDNKSGLPSHLRVKIGIKYMITYNMDVGDGLANGITGVVKDFDYDKDGSVDIIWMKFHFDSIGRNARAEYFKTNAKPGFEQCVPIKRSKIYVKLKDNKDNSILVRDMFPLRAAEAVTVHKSQGQTYHEGVCVHITSDLYDKLRTNKKVQYVALSRVTRLEDLFIEGNLDFNIKKNERSLEIETELDRLRTERKLKVAYETFEDKTGDVIVYLNTESTFNNCHQFISTDNWYKNASLLIFTETNTIKSDEIKIHDFKIAFRSDTESTLRSGGGMICYRKRNKSLERIKTVNKHKMYLSLFLYENNLYIIAGINGENKEHFKDAIKLLMKDVQKNRCLLMIGNLNANLVDFFNNFNFDNKLTCDIITADNVNTNDVVFTRNQDIQNDNVGFYYYIPSSHKPMFVILP